MAGSSLTSASSLAPLLVDEREARRLLGGLCAKTMYNLRRSGALPSVKIGSRTMYDVADLRAFIDGRKGAGHDIEATAERGCNALVAEGS
jgi:hypothetical protein